MVPFRNEVTRRRFAGLLALPLLAQKGRLFPTEIVRYADPSTEFDVYRLTSPSVSSALPAPYQKAVARRGGFLIYSSDRAGSWQAFRLDLKTGESRQFTEAEALDRQSLTLLPGERTCCYFDGPVLREGLGADRMLYRVTDGWERTAGFAVTEDGTHAVFAEKRNTKSRLRRVSLAKTPAPETIVETEGEIETPLPRPRRAQSFIGKRTNCGW